MFLPDGVKCLVFTVNYHLPSFQNFDPQVANSTSGPASGIHHGTWEALDSSEWIVLTWEYFLKGILAVRSENFLPGMCFQPELVITTKAFHVIAIAFQL